MSEEIIRILQASLETAKKLEKDLDRALALRREAMRGTEDDVAREDISSGVSSAGMVVGEIEDALVELTVAAYVVLIDSEDRTAKYFSVSPRFPRRLTELREDGRQFDLIVGVSRIVEISGEDGIVQSVILVDGPEWVLKTRDRSRLAFIACSSKDRADEEVQRLGDCVGRTFHWS